jgi:predicted ATPase/class 3 adenylate cyclase
MDVTDSRRALAVFTAVVELPVEERDAAVDAAVGADSNVRTLVERLLAQDARLQQEDEDGIGAGVTVTKGLAVGAIVDRYVVRGRLGEGGAADVYSVEHRTLGTRHALKILQRPNKTLAARLLAEGRIQATLRHPNIVRVTDVIELAGGIGLVMDEITGPSLRVRLGEGPLPMPEAMAIARGTIAGVAAAHAAGLVHRDIKPDNVLLDPQAAGVVPRVGDFGIARQQLDGGGSEGDTPKTRTGVAMGTPGYMAPEQYRDARTAGPTADVFSLGCVLYELVAGRRPFKQGDFIALFQQAEAGRFIPLSVGAPTVPSALASVIEQALRPVATARQFDATALLEAWDAALVQGDAPAQPRDPATWSGVLELPTLPVHDAASAEASAEARAPAAPPVRLGPPARLEAQPTNYGPPGTAPSPGAPQVKPSEAVTVEATVRALLLTDVVDSTAMAESLGDQRMAEVWAAHDRVARDLLPRNNGLEIDKTDGFLLLFQQAADAVAYAVAYHNGLRDLSERMGVSLAARAGLHIGPVILRENEAEDVARGAKPIEVEGLAKPVAARTMSVARAGQTLLTSAAKDAVGETELEVRSHGRWRMKGVGEPVELFEIGDENAPFLPPPDGAKVYRVVRVGSDWTPVREVPHNLPTEVQASFGRERELRAIAEHFYGGARLVTLLGPGGTGKTHLARRYAAQWLGEYPGGAWFCDLSEARTAAEVARALGAVLDVPLDAGDPFDTLAVVLAARGPTLLMLDNLEQVTGDAEDTVGPILRGAPKVQVLATSRHRLGIRGEQLLPLDPLPLPDPNDAASVADNPAVALFVDRACAVSPRFDLEKAGPEIVAKLVLLLDGLPLAIELAAARVRVLPPRRILERMGRRFDVLRSRGGKGRQSTLRAAIDWSWDLLDPEERVALAACAVFEGSFDLEAVEVVLDMEAWPEAPWSDELLESLVDKSLVRSQEVGDDLRFSLFRHIHEYATEKLADPAAVTDPDGEPATGADARSALEARHAEHFSGWGDPDGLARLHGPRGKDERSRLAWELDNVAAAVRRAAAAGEGEVAAQAAVGAMALLRSTGPFTLAEELATVALPVAPAGSAGALRVALGEIRCRAGRADAGRPLLEAALEEARAGNDPHLEASALAALAHADLLQGALDSARTHYEDALRLYRVARDVHGEAGCLRELAHVVGIRGGRFTEATSLVTQARARYVECGDGVGAALTESYAGALACIQGDLVSGHAAYVQARDLARGVGDRRTEGLAESMLGTVRMLQSELPEADAHYRRALELQRTTGDRVHEAITAFNHGELLVMQGQEDAAVGNFERVVSLAQAMGDPLTEGNALGWLGKLTARTDPEAGRERLRQAEARLEAAGDPIELAKLRCKIGEVEHTIGANEAALARLAQVQATLQGLGLAEDGELPSAVRALAISLQGEE